MPQIKWVGVIKDELATYQKGSLPSGAKKVVLPISTTQMMVSALPFAIPSFVVLFLSMFIKTYLAKQVIIVPFYFGIGLLFGLMAILIHEWLHAVVYPDSAIVSIGIYPKALAAVALVSYPLQRVRFILMSLLPVILGLVPLLLFWLGLNEWKAWNGFWFGFSILGLISPYPDYYQVYQVLKQTPKKCCLQFEGDDLYWFDD